jgi:hypothetical protein
VAFAVAVRDQHVNSTSGVVGTAGVHEHSRPAVPNALGCLVADTSLSAGYQHGLSVQTTGELSIELAQGRSSTLAANAMAVARPIPLVEPVTSALLPFKSVMRCIVLSLRMSCVTHYNDA